VVCRGVKDGELRSVAEKEKGKEGHFLAGGGGGKRPRRLARPARRGRKRAYTVWVVREGRGRKGVYERETRKKKFRMHSTLTHNTMTGRREWDAYLKRKEEEGG